MRLTPPLLAPALALALTLAAAVDAEGAWRWPARGEVLTPFALGANPYAGGQHRGIDIAARAGAPIRAPCGGVVRFAGRGPGRGRAVTLACGPLAATRHEARGRAASAPQAPAVPLAAWAGLGLLAAGTPLGAWWRVRGGRTSDGRPAVRAARL